MMQPIRMRTAIEMRLFTSGKASSSSPVLVLKVPIYNEARRFHTFVANRVQAIRDHTSPDQWHYVDNKLRQPSRRCIERFRGWRTNQKKQMVEPA